MGKRSRSLDIGCFLFGCFVGTPQNQNGYHVDQISFDRFPEKENVNYSMIISCGESIRYTQEAAGRSPLAPVIRRFSWKEIRQLTMNFSKLIGVGGFSTVYLARFPDSTLGAVKVYNYSKRLSKVFRSELEICGQLHHPNIVKLLGYCDERDEGVLVFEYMRGGNLQDILHGKACNNTPPAVVLSWRGRMAVAYQLAQALVHLHEQSSPHIVHGDIKASNILLDDDGDQHDRLATPNCKLCDFGFAKKGFSSTVQPNPSSASSISSSSPRIAMMGSPGYVDPHYLMTGIGSKKSDVYGFGVIILELITGKEAYCSEKEQLLTSLVRRRDNRDFDVNKVVEMVDSRLKGQIDMEEARAMACISVMCLRHLPSLRPTAAEICQGMREKISSISVLLESKK